LIQVSVLPLVQSDELQQFTAEIVRNLKSEGISSKVDETGHRIGRRYARTDEIGIVREAEERGGRVKGVDGWGWMV
jgi:glycyl-tRNA synthetase